LSTIPNIEIGKSGQSRVYIFFPRLRECNSHGTWLTFVTPDLMEKFSDEVLLPCAREISPIPHHYPLSYEECGKDQSSSGTWNYPSFFIADDSDERYSRAVLESALRFEEFGDSFYLLISKDLKLRYCQDPMKNLRRMMSDLKLDAGQQVHFDIGFEFQSLSPIPQVMVWNRPPLMAFLIVIGARRKTFDPYMGSNHHGGARGKTDNLDLVYAQAYTTEKELIYSKAGNNLDISVQDLMSGSSHYEKALEKWMSIFRQAEDMGFPGRFEFRVSYRLAEYMLTDTFRLDFGNFVRNCNLLIPVPSKPLFDLKRIYLDAIECKRKEALLDDAKILTFLFNLVHRRPCDNSITKRLLRPYSVMLSMRVLGFPYVLTVPNPDESLEQVTISLRKRGSERGFKSGWAKKSNPLKPSPAPSLSDFSLQGHAQRIVRGFGKEVAMKISNRYYLNPQLKVL
jgi:hypothetical protein